MPGESLKGTRPPPLPESYWVLEGRFLAGEYPGHWDADQTRLRLNRLISSGLDTFIDLTKPGELPSYLELLQRESQARARPVTYQRYPMQDRRPPTRADVIAALDCIDTALAEGHGVFLHCWGGVGRTGTVVGCYLVRHGLTGRQAVDQLGQWWHGVPKKHLHPRSPETDEQIQFILDWKEDADQ